MGKRKLAEAVAQTPISYAGLARIIECLRDGGVPSASSRETIARAVRQDLDVATPYGTVMQIVELPLVAGGAQKWSSVGFP